MPQGQVIRDDAKVVWDNPKVQWDATPNFGMGERSDAETSPGLMSDERFGKAVDYLRMLDPTSIPTAVREFLKAFEPGPVAPLGKTLTQTIPGKIRQAGRGAFGVAGPPLIAAGAVAATIPTAVFLAAAEAINKGGEWLQEKTGAYPELLGLGTDILGVAAGGKAAKTVRPVVPFLKDTFSKKIAERMAQEGTAKPTEAVQPEAVVPPLAALPTEALKPQAKEGAIAPLESAAQAARDPSINPEALNKLRSDVQNIRQEGTISEPLKPEMRTEARRLAEGKAGPAEQALGKARDSFVAVAEQLGKVSEEVAGQPQYSAALKAAGQQLELTAETFLLARRDPAMALRLLQEPLRAELSPIARKAALKYFQENGLPKTEAMLDLLKELKPGWSDMFYEAWVNGLLSGPPTHVVNFLSNLTHRLVKIPERGIAGGIDFFRAKLTGTPRERFIGEAARDTYGMVAGLQEGVRKGLRAWITEKPSFGKTRIEAARPKAIPGPTGEVIRVPGRALLGADEMFKEINFEANAHAEAYRIAVMEGKTGAARAARMEELVSKPTEAIIEAGQKDAIYRTFQQELGPSGRAIAGLRTATPGGRFVIPFLRTMLNLPKVALEHTPLNFIRIAYKNVIQKHQDFKGGVLSDELAKPVLGTMVGYLAYDLASRGYITGSGPSDPNERRVWLQMYQPNALKIGDQWIQYGRLDPFSTHIGMAADLAEARHRMSEGEYENAVSKMVFSFTQNITSRTWARGMSDALNAIVEPDRYGERWIQRLAGSAVPTGIAQIARVQSPEFRKPRTVGEALKARIPGLAGQVEPLRDIFGETVPKDVRSGPERLFSPFPRVETASDAATKEMVRLKIGMAMPSRKITVRRQRRDMTREEFAQFQAESGSMAREQINLMLQNPNWGKLTKEQQEKRIRDIFSEARERSRERIINSVIGKGKETSGETQ